MDMPKISVIVAVYNTELYLQKCIESLINQTYSNLEILLVENGCTDHCPEICAAYAAKDNRIKVLHLSPNNGISPAWNAGLDAATSDWIAFLDSDDWIEPDTYEYLLTKVLNYRADVGICGFYFQYPDHKVFSGWEVEQTLNTEQAIEYLLRDERFNSMWHKLWRKNLFDGLRFPVDEIFGDAALAHHLFGKAQRVLCLPKAKYHYTQRPDSVMKTQSIERPMSLYRIYRKRLCEMQEQWPQFYHLMVDRCITYSLLIWRDYFKFPKEERIKYRTQLRDMAAFTKEHYRTVPQYTEGGRAHKVALWLTQYAQWWSFALIAFADKLRARRSALSAQTAPPPDENVEIENPVERVVEEDPPMLKNPEPAFSEHNVPVVFACSDAFAPHAAAAMQSLIAHSTASHNYDLIFLHTEISESSQRIMQTMVMGFANVSLRFFNIKEYISPERLHVHAHYGVETFYRLLIPQLLQNYEKVIYLDSDMTVLHDVADLLKVDIGDNLLGATCDANMISMYVTNIEQMKNYLDNVLQLKQPNLYLQAGVLIFNIRQFNKAFAPYELLEFAEKNEYIYVDQDLLNAKCNGRVHILDSRWDVMPDVRKIIDRLKIKSESIYRDYLKSYKEPYIVHHAGPSKPWYDPQIDYADVYWHYARQTPFYEVILYRMMQGLLTQDLPYVPYQSRARNLADKLLPKGSRRRNLAKKILPKGSRRWNFLKKIYWTVWKK